MIVGINRRRLFSSITDDRFLDILGFLELLGFLGFFGFLGFLGFHGFLRFLVFFASVHCFIEFRIPQEFRIHRIQTLPEFLKMIRCIFSIDEVNREVKYQMRLMVKLKYLGIQENHSHLC